MRLGGILQGRGFGTSQCWFPAGHHGAVTALGWGTGLEIVSAPSPSLGTSIPPYILVFALDSCGSATCKVSTPKKLYPCKYLITQVSSPVLVWSPAAGDPQGTQSSRFHIGLWTFWRQRLGQAPFPSWW